MACLVALLDKYPKSFYLLFLLSRSFWELTTDRGKVIQSRFSPPQFSLVAILHSTGSTAYVVDYGNFHQAF